MTARKGKAKARRRAAKRKQRRAGAVQHPTNALPLTRPDRRIAYGFRCMWWDNIQLTGSKPSGLPCCPHCGGVLMEVGSETEWWAGVRAHEADGHPDYEQFIRWLRGRCFPDLAAAQAAWTSEADQ